MIILIKALLILFSILACLAPLSYGLLFSIIAPWGGLVDGIIVWGCIELALAGFNRLRLFRWITGTVVLVAASTIGMFHHFQDQGESGPLAFEWLNFYWVLGIPLVTLSILSVVFEHRRNKKSVQQLTSALAGCGHEER